MLLLLFLGNNSQKAYCGLLFKETRNKVILDNVLKLTQVDELNILR